MKLFTSHLLYSIFLLFLCEEAVVLSEEQQQHLPYKVIYDWKELDYEFVPESSRQEQINSKKFIKENNVISGIKVHGDQLYLTVPRWRPGVPAALCHLPYNSQHSVTVSGAKLKPYPSWSLNELGNCDALQYVQSMEIDQHGRMWVIDAGRVHTETDHPDNKCPPKLLLIDMKDGNKVLRTHVFPEQVVSRNSSFLHDIVVGCKTKEDCWAYITDASDGKIVVYHHGMNKSWYIKHDQSMKSQSDAKSIRLEGRNYTFDWSVGGIALAPQDSNFSALYYTPLSSFHLYCLNTDRVQTQLRQLNTHGMELELEHVTDLGRKLSQTDGMMMDSNGVLYYGLLGHNAIYKWDSTSNSRLTGQNQIELIKSDVDLQWPDTFSIDERGEGFVTTNRLHRFKSNTVDFNEVNMRVIQFHVGAMNYMRPKQGGGGLKIKRSVPSQLRLPGRRPPRPKRPPPPKPPSKTWT